MKLIDQIATQAAEYIHCRVQRSSVAVLKYGLIDIMYNTLFAAALLVISAITGDMWHGLVAIITFWILRRYSGGFHFATNARCTLASAIMVLTAIYMPVNYWYNGFVENITAIVLLFIYAPSGSHAPKELHQKFKWVAVLIVSSNFVIQSGLLANVFFVQALTTPLILQRIINRYKL